MNNPLIERVNASLTERETRALRRQLVARPADTRLIDLANNDYLRLSRHPKVIEAARAALDKWGASASASPLITGYTDLHKALELRLSEWSGFGHGLVWNTGYAANQAVLGVLPQKGDLILADRLIHNSMVNGILSSGARLIRYRHLDMGHLGDLLAQHRDRYKEIFVVTESVFSMDGDYPELDTLAALKNQYVFCWILDEAHAVGWYGMRGSGLAEASGVTSQVDVFVGTLGKGLGSMGAYTLFHNTGLRDYLINFASEFIYSTYLAPSAAAAALASVDIAESMTEERAYWQGRSRDLRREINRAPQGDSPVIPVLTREAGATMRAASTLAEKGFRVGAVRPPTVPDGSARLRISLNTKLTDIELKELASALKEVSP